MDWPSRTDGGKDGGSIVTAIIAQDVQGRDFVRLAPRAPLFLDPVTGAVTKHFDPAETNGADIPFFINEAAYYEKGIAMYFGRSRVEETTIWKDAVDKFMPTGSKL